MQISFLLFLATTDALFDVSFGNFNSKKKRHQDEEENMLHFVLRWSYTNIFQYLSFSENENMGS